MLKRIIKFNIFVNSSSFLSAGVFYTYSDTRTSYFLRQCGILISCRHSSSCSWNLLKITVMPVQA